MGICARMMLEQYHTRNLRHWQDGLRLSSVAARE